MFLSFGVKTPLVPLHGWLPETHTNAPTAVCVLSGQMLRGHSIVSMTAVHLLATVKLAPKVLIGGTHERPFAFFRLVLHIPRQRELARCSFSQYH